MLAKWLGANKRKPPARQPRNKRRRREGGSAPLFRSLGKPAQRKREDEDSAADLRAKLSASQRSVADRAVAGENVFLTGAAGTGKSFTFRYIVSELKRKHGEEAVAVTAPTGVAAVNVGGCTIHSFAGFGLGRGTSEQLIARVLANRTAPQRWRRTKVLLIDEVSMLDAGLLDALEAIACAVRRGEGCFGGMQVVCCGDFCQLPPVTGGFAFKSAAWGSLRMRTCELTEVIRQATDPSFIVALNELRCGRLSGATQAKLAACHVSTKPLPEDGIVPTRLFCCNVDVSAQNTSRLRTLPGEAVSFRSIDWFKTASGGLNVPEDQRERLKADAEKRVSARLELKLNAQVVLLRNRDHELVNGSRGVVVGFAEANDESGAAAARGSKWPVVKFSCGRTETLTPEKFSVNSGSRGSVERAQVPLKLAWALTVHKSQGMTLSRCEVMVANAFEAGQAYVALSRCASLAGLWMSGPPIGGDAVRAHPAVLDFYRMGSVGWHSSTAAAAPSASMQPRRATGDAAATAAAAAARAERLAKAAKLKREFQEKRARAAARTKAMKEAPSAL